MSNPYRAFLSSTYDDLKQHRKIVIASLRACGIFIDPMEEWQAHPAEPKAFSQDAIKGCDMFVLLVSYRRGHVPPGETKSITQLEYRAAINMLIDPFVWVLAEGEEWPSEFDERADPAVQAWRSSFRDLHGLMTFHAEPSSVRVEPSIVRWVVAKSRSATIPMASPALDANVLSPLDLAPLSDPTRLIDSLHVSQIEQDLRLILSGRSSQVPLVNLRNGDTWWSTRLFLLCSLLRDFTDVKLVGFVDVGGYVGVASPGAAAAAFATLVPDPDSHYQFDGHAWGRDAAIARAVSRFGESFEAGTEQVVKCWMTGDSVRRVLGAALGTAVVFADGEAESTTARFLFDVVSQRADDVAILGRDKAVRFVIDRRGLADKLATEQLRAWI
jgi:hypothetical protein